MQTIRLFRKDQPEHDTKIMLSVIVYNVLAHFIEYVASMDIVYKYN